MPRSRERAWPSGDVRDPGRVLVIGALVGTGLYLGQAEAGPGRIRGANASSTREDGASAATGTVRHSQPGGVTLSAEPTPAAPTAPIRTMRLSAGASVAAPKPTAAAPPPPRPAAAVSNDRPVTSDAAGRRRPRALAAGSAAPSRAPRPVRDSAATGKSNAEPAGEGRGHNSDSARETARRWISSNGKSIC